MKKMLTILLALALVISIVPAFASGNSTDAKTKIDYDGVLTDFDYYEEILYTEYDPEGELMPLYEEDPPIIVIPPVEMVPPVEIYPPIEITPPIQVEPVPPQETPIQVEPVPPQLTPIHPQPPQVTPVQPVPPHIIPVYFAPPYVMPVPVMIVGPHKIPLFMRVHCY